jgi:hypothetical protein
MFSGGTGSRLGAAAWRGRAAAAAWRASRVGVDGAPLRPNAALVTHSACPSNGSHNDAFPA